MLDAATAKSEQACSCCPGASASRTTKTVGDIWTWQLCFNRYVAAVAAIHPKHVPGMLAHANTVLQAAQQFEGDGWRVYDRAVRLQASSDPQAGWGIINIVLYARTFTAATRRHNACRFCCSREHPSQSCPWGVDSPGSRASIIQHGPRPYPQGTSPCCMSWNAGACRFPRSCRFRHVCSTCGDLHKRIECHRPPTAPPPTTTRQAPCLARMALTTIG